MATGDVVGILNSDDFYTDENVLQTVADNFMNYSVDAVYGDIHFVHDADLGKCVRYYSSRLFSRHFGYVSVSCPLILPFIANVRFSTRRGYIVWITRLELIMR